MWSARMEIWNRPEARTDFRSAETTAPADWYRANKVRLIRATRAARNESGTGRPSNLLARTASLSRPHAKRTAHHRELHRGLRRLPPARSREIFLSQSRERLSRSIFPSPTTPVFSVRSMDVRLAAHWRGYI